MLMSTYKGVRMGLSHLCLHVHMTLARPQLYIWHGNAWNRGDWERIRASHRSGFGLCCDLLRGLFSHQLLIYVQMSNYAIASCGQV